jgi:hypothetical protein
VSVTGGWGCHYCLVLIHGLLCVTMHQVFSYFDLAYGERWSQTSTGIVTTLLVDNWASRKLWSTPGSYGQSRSWWSVVLLLDSVATPPDLGW